MLTHYPSSLFCRSDKKAQSLNIFALVYREKRSVEELSKILFCVIDRFVNVGNVMCVFSPLSCPDCGGHGVPGEGEVHSPGPGCPQLFGGVQEHQSGGLWPGPLRGGRRVHGIRGRQIPHQVGCPGGAQLHALLLQERRVGLWRAHVGGVHLRQNALRKTQKC